MSIIKTRGEAVTFLNTSHDYPGLAGHAASNRAICCNVLARCLPSSPFARERSADMSETLKAWREKSLHQRTDIADDHPSLERICVTLETATRKYAAMKANLRETTHELRLLQHRHQDLSTHAKLEVFRRKNAERQAANLREQLERVQNQLHSEVAARAEIEYIFTLSFFLYVLKIDSGTEQGFLRHEDLVIESVASDEFRRNTRTHKIYTPEYISFAL